MLRIRNSGLAESLMAQHGYTHEQLARMMPIPISRSAMWRRMVGLSQVDEVDARRIAHILGVRVVDIFQEEQMRRRGVRRTDQPTKGDV